MKSFPAPSFPTKNRPKENQFKRSGGGGGGEEEVENMEKAGQVGKDEVGGRVVDGGGRRRLGREEQGAFSEHKVFGTSV